MTSTQSRYNRQFLYHIGISSMNFQFFWSIVLFLRALFQFKLKIWISREFFWSWVLERSLERKSWQSALSKNLVDFAIFLILSYQCDMISQKTFSIISQKLSIIKIFLYFAQNQDILANFSLSPYNLSLLSQNTLYNLSKNSLYSLIFPLLIFLYTYFHSIIKIILTHDHLGTNFTFVIFFWDITNIGQAVIMYQDLISRSLSKVCRKSLDKISILDFRHHFRPMIYGCQEFGMRLCIWNSKTGSSTALRLVIKLDHILYTSRLATMYS